MEIISKRIQYVYTNEYEKWLHDKYNWTRAPGDVWVGEAIRTPASNVLQDRITAQLTDQLHAYVSKGAARYVNTDGSYTSTQTKVIQVDNWQPTLATAVFDVIKQTHMFDFITLGGKVHKLVGCSNQFFHLYCMQGGEHFPHIDGADVISDETTVKALAVLMHWSNANTGQFAIVKSKQHTGSTENIREWDHQAADGEIVAAYNPQFGRVFVFPNETCCHAVLPFHSDDGTCRISTRGDLLYQPI